MLNTSYYQLTHTTLKNVELLKHSKINKNSRTCFGLHGNHLQGAKVSTWLKVTRLVNSRCVKEYHGFVSAMAAYCDLYGVCVVHCVRVYCRQYTVDSILYTVYSRQYTVYSRQYTVYSIL